jgi:hypothetical protein
MTTLVWYPLCSPIGCMELYPRLGHGLIALSALVCGRGVMGTLPTAPWYVGAFLTLVVICRIMFHGQRENVYFLTHILCVAIPLSLPKIHCQKTIYVSFCHWPITLSSDTVLHFEQIALVVFQTMLCPNRSEWKIMDWVTFIVNDNNMFLITSTFMWMLPLIQIL